MTTTPKIDFVFDYISHNAYLAWAKLPELASDFGFEVRHCPVLFAGLLEHHGQRGPAEIPAKSRWMLRNVKRKALVHGIPLEPPAAHPFNPLVPLRATCSPLTEQRRADVVQVLFEGAWAMGRPIYDAHEVARLLDSIGLDGPACVASTQLPEVKRALRHQTERAIARGVFGVPTMIVDRADGSPEELFYGFDDFEHLRRYLAGTDPLAGEDLSSWEQIEAQARRARDRSPRST